MSEKAFVLFDLGETLVDLTELVASLARLLGTRFPILQHEGGELAREWILEASRQMPRQEGQPFVSEFTVASEVLAKVLSRRGVEVSSEDAGRILRAAWDDFEPRARFCQGVSESWLGEIKDLSAGLGIVTDGDRENVSRLLQRLRIGAYFYVVVTSEEARAYKPNPRIYRAALQALHAVPERTIFVSDSPLDLMGAERVGIQPALLGGRLFHARDLVPRDAILLGGPDELKGVLRRFLELGRFASLGRP